MAALFLPYTERTMTEEFLKVAERLGVPAAIVFAIFYFGYYAFKWAGSKIVEPLLRTHTEIMHIIKENNTTNTNTLSSLAIAEEDRIKCLREVAQQSKETHTEAQKTNEQLLCLCTQTNGQNKLLYQLATAICTKEGMPLPEKPVEHQQCSEARK